MQLLKSFLGKEKFRRAQGVLRRAVKFERRAHTKRDWFALAVLAAALILGAGILLSVIQSASDEIALQYDDTEFTRAVVEGEKETEELRVKIATSDSTPEKTYEALRQAHLNNDIDGALEQFHPSVRDDFEENLRAVFERGEFQSLAENWPSIFFDESFLNDEFETNYFYWDTFREQSYKHTVSFKRDKNADWKITSI